AARRHGRVRDRVVDGAPARQARLAHAARAPAPFTPAPLARAQAALRAKLELTAARHARVEDPPGAFLAVPRTARRGLRVFRRARLEEVRVLDAVQDLREPRQRMLLRVV